MADFFLSFSKFDVFRPGKRKFRPGKKIILGPFSFSTHEIIWPVKFIVKINW